MKMDFLSCDSDNLLINSPPLLRKHFEELFCDGKIGLTPFTPSDISFTKQYTANSSTYSYYYTLKIPYAGKRLSWELIFDPEDMSFAPDFNFNDDSFYMSYDRDTVIENIPSLVNWNVNDSKSLTNVLREFLNLYKKQQLEKLHQENMYSFLNSEYQSLIDQVVEPSDVEVYLENINAHFVINIKVPVSSLPEYSQPKRNDQYDDLLNPGEDICILKVSYLKLDGSRVNASLQLSPRLEQALGKFKTLQIPNFSKDISLGGYVISVVKTLKDEIAKVEQHYRLKKEYISCLCTMYAHCVIEYDSETFSKGTFLCKVDEFTCLVHVNIGNLFPQEKPTVTVYSIYCLSSKKTCSRLLEDYPYSPRWSPDVMLKRLFSHLAEIIPLLKKHKH